MARSGPYKVWGKRVLDEVKSSGNADLIEAVASTIDVLVNNPTNDPIQHALSILPYEDAGCPNCFTVAVGDHGLLLYQVYRDYPIIKLIQFLGG